MGEAIYDNFITDVDGEVPVGISRFPTGILPGRLPERLRNWLEYNIKIQYDV